MFFTTKVRTLEKAKQFQKYFLFRSVVKIRLMTRAEKYSPDKTQLVHPSIRPIIRFFSLSLLRSHSTNCSTSRLGTKILVVQYTETRVCMYSHTHSTTTIRFPGMRAKLKAHLNERIFWYYFHIFSLVICYFFAFFYLPILTGIC